MGPRQMANETILIVTGLLLREESYSLQPA
jgi:hypothetical protein